MNLILNYRANYKTNIDDKKNCSTSVRQYKDSRKDLFIACVTNTSRLSFQFIPGQNKLHCYLKSFFCKIKLVDDFTLLLSIFNTPGIFGKTEKKKRDLF